MDVRYICHLEIPVHLLGNVSRCRPGGLADRWISLRVQSFWVQQVSRTQCPFGESSREPHLFSKQMEIHNVKEAGVKLTPAVFGSRNFRLFVWCLGLSTSWGLGGDADSWPGSSLL